MGIKLHPSWLKYLETEFEKEYMKELKVFLKQEKESQKNLFPKSTDIFAAFEATPLNKVKVVIIGQDPYHGSGQAHGLSFSVPEGVQFPPSLRNIFKELSSDMNVPSPKNGNLLKWANQGVLMLNSVLTVEEGKAASHQGKGWERFTDKVIQVINEHNENVVFILWGAYAQKKAAFVDRKRHFVIQGVHPSPLSSHRGFFGSKPFSQVNHYLKSKQKSEIDWSL